MSRIGKRPIDLPKGVNVTLSGATVEVKGPKGSLKRQLPPQLKLEVKNNQALLSLKDEIAKNTAALEFQEARRLHGTTRALLNNAVHGVSAGFRQGLKLEGTGYKVEPKGKELLNFSLGLSHPVEYPVPKSVTFAIEQKGTVIMFESHDKELLGQVIAKIQSYRPPEPYKGKGVRFIKAGVDITKPNPELIKIPQKEGKAGGKGGKGGK